MKTKRREVEALLSREQEIVARLDAAPEPRDLSKALRREEEVSVMAEVKRRSPGAGPIRPGLDPGALAEEYGDAGAAAVSVLTDGEYFGGSLDDLEEVRSRLDLPVFRKDFVIHPLQLLEARAAGADGVLLIARILDAESLRVLHERAVDVGLCPLVEVHDTGELASALDAGATLVGVNNRNLQTFETSLDVTLDLLPSVPLDVTVVAESGIRSRDEVDLLGAAGVHAVLVGESFLRAPEPGRAVAGMVGRGRTDRAEGRGRG